MKVFLDTNVVLDYLLERQVFLSDAERLFESAYSAHIQLYISSLSRKVFSRDELYAVISDLRTVIDFTTIDDKVIQQTLSLKAKDFEDAIQYFSALQAGVNCIITRNIKDFEFAEIEVMTPSVFIEKYL